MNEFNDGREYLNMSDEGTQQIHAHRSVTKQAVYILVVLRSAGWHHQSSKIY